MDAKKQETTQEKKQVIKKEMYEKPEIKKEGELKDITATAPAPAFTKS